MKDLLTKSLIPLEPKLNLKRILRLAVEFYIPLTKIQTRVRETLVVRKVKRNVDAIKGKTNDFGDSLELLAQVAGTTLEKVKKDVEKKNRDQLMDSLNHQVQSTFSNSLKQSGLTGPQWAYFWLNLPLKYEAQSAKNLERFYTKMVKKAYWQLMTDGFPKNSMRKRYQALGGFDGFSKRLSVDFKRTLIAYWLASGRDFSEKKKKREVK